MMHPVSKVLCLCFLCFYAQAQKARIQPFQTLGKGEVPMYFVNAIQPSLSVDGKGFRPNEVFEQKRDELYKA